MGNRTTDLPPLTKAAVLDALEVAVMARQRELAGGASTVAVAALHADAVWATLSRLQGRIERGDRTHDD